jgi:hypothetical protein
MADRLSLAKAVARAGLDRNVAAVAMHSAFWRSMVGVCQGVGRRESIDHWSLSDAVKTTIAPPPRRELGKGACIGWIFGWIYDPDADPLIVVADEAAA